MAPKGISPSEHWDIRFMLPTNIHAKPDFVKPLSLYSATLSALRSLGNREGRKTQDGWINFFCPAHNGEHLKLGVKEGDNGSVILKCLSRQCSREEIFSTLKSDPKNFS